MKHFTVGLRSDTVDICLLVYKDEEVSYRSAAVFIWCALTVCSILMHLFTQEETSHKAMLPIYSSANSNLSVQVGQKL